MFKKKRKKHLWFVSTLVLLCLGGGAAAYWWQNQEESIAIEVSAADELIPQEAVFVASISTNSRQWQQIRELGTPETQAAFQRRLSRWRSELLTVNGYKYQRDIKPWLGSEITIAFLGSTTSKTDPRLNLSELSREDTFTKQPLVAILPVKNPIQVQRLWDNANLPVTAKVLERTYKRIQIKEIKSPDSLNYSLTILGDFAIVATHPKAIEQVIDTYFGAASLATTPGYAESLTQLTTEKPFAEFYLNIPTALQEAAASSIKSVSTEEIEQQQKQGVAGTVSIEGEELSIDGILWLKPDSQQTYLLDNSAERMPKLLPIETRLMLAGSDLQQFWQGLVADSQLLPLIPFDPYAISDFIKATTDLDWEEDFLPWMGEEFSLAVIPVSANQPSQQHSGYDLGGAIAFLVEVSDRSTAEKTLAELDRIVASKYKFGVKSTKIGGKPVVNWTSPLEGINATRGWLESDVVFLTIGAPVAEEFLPQPKANLRSNELFKKVVLTGNNNSENQFFLDVERTINGGNLGILQLPAHQQMLLDAIRTIGFTTATNDETSTRFEIVLQLKNLAIAPQSDLEIQQPLPKGD
ncbi:DUF3352 domain-containing protein [Oscillatoria salina]|uniref:DUF3352 domain-containing protein n=1 Tax=Oscillatoria salina TaxID=331517 RepID=UPI001CCEC481|nr:DUF3352 domain-containing protein [Oscillatoria salina]MBZ8181854.1 DUF3352 domain-containing protein [Oscillatoria salina IIICB1]